MCRLTGLHQLGCPFWVSLSETSQEFGYREVSLKLGCTYTHTAAGLSLLSHSIQVTLLCCPSPNARSGHMKAWRCFRSENRAAAAGGWLVSLSPTPGLLPPSRHSLGHVTKEAAELPPSRGKATALSPHPRHLLQCWPTSSSLLPFHWSGSCWFTQKHAWALHSEDRAGHGRSSWMLWPNICGFELWRVRTMCSSGRAPVRFQTLHSVFPADFL